MLDRKFPLEEMKSYSTVSEPFEESDFDTDAKLRRNTDKFLTSSRYTKIISGMPKLKGSGGNASHGVWRT